MIAIPFSEEKMDIFLKNDSGYDINVNSISGGEKTALSLAMRLSIAQKLDIKFKIFILDEPTDGMDNEMFENYRFLEWERVYKCFKPLIASVSGYALGVVLSLL